MSISYKRLKPFVAAYAALPVFVFFIGYLKPFYALVGSLVYLYALWHVLEASHLERDHAVQIRISPQELVVIFLIMLLWGYLGGMNGLFYQSDDWNARNAIYRDLITHTWPVVYQKKSTALVYYIGHWLVPAALMKPFYYFWGMDITWPIARMVLWVWTACGTFLIALLLMIYVKAEKLPQKCICLAGFIGFSGMDALGAWLYGTWNAAVAPDNLHFEWWTSYQFSSLTTCHYWVFNQAIIPWLVVLCILFERGADNYLFWGIACFLCGPFPFVGVAVLMLIKAGTFLVREYKQGNTKQALLSIFSRANLTAFVGVFSLLILFFLSNNALSLGVKSSAASGSTQGNRNVLLSFIESIRVYLSSTIIRAFVLEAGVYLYLLRKREKGNPLFYGTALSLFILPFFKIGSASDFAMRATIPAVFLLMIFCVKAFLYYHDNWPSLTKKEHTTGICLILVFIVGLMTPAMEVYRGIYNVCANGTIFLENDSVLTLETEGITNNFEASAYTDRFFFSTVAKATDVIGVSYVDGCYGVEETDQDAPEKSFRWCKKKAEFMLCNGYSHEVSCTLELVFGMMMPMHHPHKVHVTCGDQTYTYVISQQAQTVRIPLILPKKGMKMEITTDCNRMFVPEDRRTLYFSVAGIRLYDSNGQLQFGEPPQHPELETPAEAVS